ncbi:hypothetical protein [Bradyrhizobium mercantei]|uniref:hypothetical protein n=1 Tax=Bradyrhizobium mercantei TaxID=1904807 RepID=UPI000977D15A|nr:hypothetical protein [Bradyrhizobium mercantei]
MSLPPLYKYLSVQGAKLTLGNQCFRFAKPSEYDDLEDMTVQSLFPDKLEKALATMPDGFVDAVMANLYAPPTCPPGQRPTVVKLQTIFRQKPELSPIVAAGLKEDPEKAGLGVEAWKTRSEAFVKETNGFMQNYRVFCVTTDKTSERMWKEYAQETDEEVSQSALDTAYSNALNAIYSARKSETQANAATSFDDIVAARNIDVLDMADEMDIARGVLADLFDGAMLRPARKRLKDAVCEMLKITSAMFDGAHDLALNNPRFGHAKATGAPVMRARPCDEIIRDSPMTPERVRYWLEEV